MENYYQIKERFEKGEELTELEEQILNEVKVSKYQVPDSDYKDYWQNRRVYNTPSRDTCKLGQLML